ncbi:MAG: O-antigen ligase family protein [Sphingomonadales bacterium]|nr:O-antigen ligase family protein [Sphingomonadales bacterium]
MQPPTANKPISTSASAQPQSDAWNWRTWVVDEQLLASLWLCLFLAYTYIGIHPFAVSEPKKELGETGGANAIRQVLFIMFWMGSVVMYWRKGDATAVFRHPALWVVLLYATASVGWSVVPSIALRRVFLLWITTTTLFMLTDLAGERIITWLARTHVLLLMVSLMAIPILKGARHTYVEEGDPMLVGNWKGIFQHKNHAGPAQLISILLFIYAYIRSKDPLWWLAVLGSLLFIGFTQSKTTLLLLMPSLVAGLLFYLSSESRLRRLMLGLSLTGLILGLVATQSVWMPKLLKILEDPEAFTGRAMIWLTMVLALPHYWLMGMGYGSVWQVGNHNILSEFAPVYADWVVLNNQGHNGYLDLVLSLGVSGLGLFLFLVLAQSIISFFLRGRPRHSFHFLFYSALIFTILHNLLESTFLRADNPFWLMFLALLMLNNKNDKEREPYAPL